MEHMFYNTKVLAGRSYWFISRPAGIVHGHPVLVFDSRARVHLPLTTFARVATRRLSASSVRAYLYALLPFFTFMDGRGRGGEQGLWTSEGVRHTVAEYLEGATRLRHSASPPGIRACIGDGKNARQREYLPRGAEALLRRHARGWLLHS